MSASHGTISSMRAVLWNIVLVLGATCLAGAAFWASFFSVQALTELPPHPTQTSRYTGVVLRHNVGLRELTVMQASTLPSVLPPMPVRFAYTDDTRWGVRTVTFASGTIERFEYEFLDHMPTLVPDTFVMVVRDPYENAFVAESIIFFRRIDI